MSSDLSSDRAAIRAKFRAKASDKAKARAEAKARREAEAVEAKLKAQRRAQYCRDAVVIAFTTNYEQAVEIGVAIEREEYIVAARDAVIEDYDEAVTLYLIPNC